MSETTSTPQPPNNLVWRAITHDDLAAVVKLADDCHLADGGLAFLNEPSNLKGRYFPDGLGVAIGAFGADTQLVACATVHLNHTSDAARAKIIGQVHPDLRNKGIGTFLIQWSQLQAQALLATTTSNIQRLQIATESLNEPAIRLYHAHGFNSIFEELVMQRDLNLPLPNFPLPPDVTIASWQPTLANQFFQAYEASFRDRLGFPGINAAEWIADNIEDDGFKPEWSLLARTDDVRLGFITAGVERSGGFIIQIGVIPDQRRRGLGSALMVEAMRRMRVAGETAVQLAVNVNNPGAIQAYAQLDFVTVGRRARYERSAK